MAKAGGVRRLMRPGVLLSLVILGVVGAVAVMMARRDTPKRGGYVVAPGPLQRPIERRLRGLRRAGLELARVMRTDPALHTDGVRLGAALTRAEMRAGGPPEWEHVASVEGKGDLLQMCVVADGALVPWTDSWYVFVHELAHIISVSEGHTPEFHAKFKQLRRVAAAHGMMSDAAPEPRRYCGVDFA